MSKSDTDIQITTTWHDALQVLPPTDENGESEAVWVTDGNNFMMDRIIVGENGQEWKWSEFLITHWAERGKLLPNERRPIGKIKLDIPAE